MKYLCPVCGFKDLDKPAYFENGEPSYQICRACFYEYGYDDDSEGITHSQWRDQWISEGMPWRSNPKNQPADWNPKKDLETIGVFLP